MSHILPTVERSLLLLKEVQQLLGSRRWRKLQQEALEGRGNQWHKRVFVPLDYIFQQINREAPELFTKSLMLVNELAALLPWNLTKGAYLFDQTLFEELWEAPLEHVPHSILLRLPEWAPLVVFPYPVEMPLFGTVQGGWIFLEDDRAKKSPHLEFRILLITKNGYMPMMLDLIGQTFQEALEATYQEALLYEQLSPISHLDQFRDASKHFLKMSAGLRGWLNLALYLCSEEPDLSKQPRLMPTIRHAKGEVWIKPPQEPLEIQVGWRWGACLRKARQAQTHQEHSCSIKPHVRRGHWHL